MQRLLARRLEALSNSKSRTFWENYMKGVLPFRGVPMKAIRECLHAWWREDGPSELSITEKKTLALTLFEGTFGEDKLAGTLAFSELLLGDLNIQDLSSFEKLFARGLISDWNSCDWFCVKVLGKWVARELPSRSLAKKIVSWSAAESLWQRRAANVAFVNLAKFGDSNFHGFTQLMIKTCDETVKSPERFAQTGVGWILRELSLADPAAVTEFMELRMHLMSRECVRYVIEKSPQALKSRMLTKHQQLKRVTSDECQQ